MAAIPLPPPLAFSPALSRLAYQAQQRSFKSQCLAGQLLLRKLVQQKVAPSREAHEAAERGYSELLKRDLANVEAGYYPRELLFQFPILSYAKQAPRLLLDMPRTIRRMRSGNYRDLPESATKDRYPAYFRRNFHWQTDGYFSRRSAELYDVGVEFLFLGTADVMRRQVIPPISRLVAQRGDDLRVLDVACGTGRTLSQISTALPKLKYYGLDLSPHYIQHARRELLDVEHLSLLHENAEHMPFVDEHFDVLTSVHLFHELPKNVRRNVFREMFRVLAPGGMLVIQDSLQETDAGPLSVFLGRFSEDFHEPFYKDYIRDPIEHALEDIGFEVESVESHYVAKVVVAKRPEHS